MLKGPEAGEMITVSCMPDRICGISKGLGPKSLVG